MAPEMVSGEYQNSKIDVWAFGAILYFLISGEKPFDAETLPQLVEQIKQCKVSFDKEAFAHVSSACKDLIQKCLTKNPHSRCSIQEVLTHEWFSEDQQASQEETGISPQVVSRLKTYSTTSYFEKTAMNILVKLLKESEIAELTSVFRKIDLDQTGLISPAEIAIWLREQHQNVSD